MQLAAKAKRENEHSTYFRELHAKCRFSLGYRLLQRKAASFWHIHWENKYLNKE